MTTADRAEHGVTTISKEARSRSRRSTYIVSIPGIFQGNWKECENILGVQNYTYTSSLSGRHKPGVTPYLKVGTWNTVKALSATAESGAIAFDTTYDIFRRFSGPAVGGTWDPIEVTFEAPCCDVYLASDTTITSGSDSEHPVVVPFDTETLDTYSAFDSVTDYIFTAPTDGYYMIQTQVTWTPDEAGIDARLSIPLYNSSLELKNSTTNYRWTWSSNTACMQLEVVYAMEATDFLGVALYHNDSDDQTIEGGSDYTILKVYKVA